VPVPITYFTDFLQNIRLTRSQSNDAKEGHRRLRERLNADEDLSPHIIATFLQGSYRRSTAIRPQGETKSDVDVVVVTNLSELDYEPAEALRMFEPFLERHYAGKYHPQGRSYGIVLADAELDLVVTSAPAEAEQNALKASSSLSEFILDDTPVAELSEAAALSARSASSAATWKLNPLRIPNRETDSWEDTHPIAQIEWTINKNATCNKHFVNVVKSLKWWQRLNSEEIPRPRGYPLEHLIGDNCPDGIESIEEGIVLTLRSILDAYKADYEAGTVPNLTDRGTSGNVMHRITGDEFASFYNRAREASLLAEEAWSTADPCHAINQWRLVFGKKFPPPPSECEDQGEEGYTNRNQTTKPQPARFAIPE